MEALPNVLRLPSLTHLLINFLAKGLFVRGIADSNTGQSANLEKDDLFMLMKGVSFPVESVDISRNEVSARN